MFKTEHLVIENDDFSQKEIRIFIGDEVKIYTEGFISIRQKYSLLTDEVGNPVISNNIITHKFERTGEFSIKCLEKVWMNAKIFVKEREGLEETICFLEPPSVIKLVPSFSEMPKQNTAVQSEKVEKKKTKEKKSIQKFKKRLKTQKKVFSDLCAIISDLISFTTKFEKSATSKTQKVSEYLSSLLTTSNVQIPEKYKDPLIKSILAFPSYSASEIILSIFNISQKSFTSYTSNLAVEEIEQMLESRNFYLGWINN